MRITLRPWRMEHTSKMSANQLIKLKKVVCGMIAATSAYKEYARGWKERGNADPFKRTRVKDFEEAAEAGKELLSEIEK